MLAKHGIRHQSTGKMGCQLLFFSGLYVHVWDNTHFITPEGTKRIQSYSLFILGELCAIDIRVHKRTNQNGKRL